MMDVWDAIRQKHAVRQYSDVPLPEADARRILEAGRRAQSWTNDQLWNFIAVRDRARLEKLAAMGNWLRHVSSASMCVVLLLPTEHERTVFNFFDLGQSAAYMQLAAQELGIGSCLGTIHDPEALRRLLKHPPEWQGRLLIAFGYPLAQESHPPKLGGRRAFDEVVHWEEW